MLSVLACLRHDHELRLLLLAALVCVVGVYAAFAIAVHAGRSIGRARRGWGLVAIVASGCTAWATHFIALLSYIPRMPAAFEPVLTAVSLLAAIIGIGAGLCVAFTGRGNRRQFLAGVVIGGGICALHYLGQYAYAVQGTVTWNPWLVILSIPVSVLMSGLALLAIVQRSRALKRIAAPLLILSIAILHFFGMAAMTLRYDARIQLPANAISPDAITPAVAGVSLALLALAVTGWRFDLSAKLRLRRDHLRLRELADVALEGLLICDGDAVITGNNSIERLSGFDRSRLAGSFVSSLFPGLDVPSLPEREEREAELLNVDGQPVPVRVLRSEVTLGHKRQTVLAVRDQRERLRTEAKMRSLAFSDPLTGLPNRTRFFDLLATHAASRRQSDRSFSVLMIDLDRFKPVNDTLGHASGDIVLRKVADRLRSLIRDDDVIARIGGDEFAVLQVGVGEGNTGSLLAARIVAAMADRPFMFSGQAIYLGASVGIATAPTDGDDPADLLHKADLALYAAKAGGKGQYRLYDPALDEHIQQRLAMEAGLRRAIVQGELELHYQPVLDARSRVITGAEALVRWRDPSGRLVPPIEFIPLAEETGLIIPLGEWVLRTACAEAASWPDYVSVAINLSPAQFREASLATMIRAALDDAGLAPHRLELEITEGVLLSNEQRTLDTLADLRAAGVRISMDDFGTGYSSLGYLRRFRFDKIKIDQSFVRQAPADLECVAIIRAIITMATCLGISTTAEGVETTEQFEFCVGAGCAHVQGYLISRPVHDAEIRRLLYPNGQDASVPKSLVVV